MHTVHTQSISCINIMLRLNKYHTSFVTSLCIGFGYVQYHNAYTYIYIYLRMYEAKGQSLDYSESRALNFKWK